ncbi:hypothetical protein CGC45_07590 [Francisella opportunistica]|uniref:YkuD domain-containing protein n=1 Tax=Francisella opportunistica TaxID=2016517 RepID=A0A345JTT4_9GAMM|nr:hypothetical protein CGC43_07580 [Francisella opportunistica]AXH32376.1 hypothetical protein CGC44_07555 [Francisella opportunistica]AXH34023.1 hypothetical protein CGC45_07590 [Francisella opportunistica]
MTARLWYFNKIGDNNWIVVKSARTVVVGKNGLAWADSSYQNLAKAPLKQEGDSKSPAGIFSLGKIFGVANMTLANYIQLKTGIICIDDSNSKYYNHIVDSKQISDKDWHSAENMSKISLYKYGIEVLYNANPAIPKKGSCIFMHIWKSATIGTEGCTAMAEDDISDIQASLDSSKKPVLVQLPQYIYEQVKNDWQLPDLS